MTGESFGEALRQLMAERGIGVRALARAVPCDPGHISKLCHGAKGSSERTAARLDELLGGDGRLVTLVATRTEDPVPVGSVDSERVHANDLDEDDEEMQRRRLLQALATLGAASSPAMEAIEHIRGGVDRALGRDEGGHVDDWEETLAEYGYSYLLLPPHQLLKDLAADLVAVQQITSRHADDRLFGAWCRVTSGLALLMAKTLCNLGQARLARDWWITAQHAADTAGDADLSLWVAGERLTHNLYEHRPTVVLLRKANDLVGQSAGSPCRGLAIVRTVRAQLLALEGRAGDAAAELRACEEIFHALPASAKDVRSVTGWAEDRVRHSQAWVYAHTGDRVQLEESVARARALVPSSDRRGHAQLGLLQAAGHVRAGDVSEGVRLAHGIYEAQPTDHRTTLVTGVARQVADAVPPQGRAEPAVVAYLALLDSASGRKSIT